ncbi:MAG: methyl-accepting chemotaxis protein [Fibrobacterota bacterium]
MDSIRPGDLLKSPQKKRTDSLLSLAGAAFFSSLYSSVSGSAVAGLLAFLCVSVLMVSVQITAVPRLALQRRKESDSVFLNRYFRTDLMLTLLLWGLAIPAAAVLSMVFLTELSLRMGFQLWAVGLSTVAVVQVPRFFSAVMALRPAKIGHSSSSFQLDSITAVRIVSAVFAGAALLLLFAGLSPTILQILVGAAAFLACAAYTVLSLTEIMQLLRESLLQRIRRISDPAGEYTPVSLYPFAEEALTTAVDHIADRDRAYARILNRIARGRTDADLSHVGSDYCGTALRRCVHALNQLFRRMEESSTVISRTAEDLTASGSTLTSFSEKYGTAIKDLAESVDTIKERIEKNVEKLSESNEQVSEITEAAEEGQGSMTKMTDAMHSISNSSKDIGKVLKTIEDISFQTSLLALNASVEASRAGQHGKGFAVVANEVRALANRSSESVENSSKLVDVALKNITQGGKVVGDIESSFEAINFYMEELDDHFRDNEEVNEEQVRAISRIEENILKVQKLTDTDNSDLSSLAGKSRRIAEESERISSVIRTFRTQEDGEEDASEHSDSTDRDGDGAHNQHDSTHHDEDPRSESTEDPDSGNRERRGSNDETDKHIQENSRDWATPDDQIELDESEFGKY